MSETSTLVLDIVAGAEVDFNGAGIKVQLVRKSGSRARMRITAPRSVKITVAEASTIAMRCTKNTATSA